MSEIAEFANRESAERLLAQGLPSREEDEEAPLLHNDTNEQNKEAWNDPPSNKYKVGVVFLGFTILGLSDSALGVVLPEIELGYGLDDFQASFVFLTPVTGVVLGAFSSGAIHAALGRGGVALACTMLVLLFYSVTMLPPPYPVLLLMVALYGCGAGVINGSWNAWIGAFRDAHGILGMLHGFYSLGGIIGPSLIAIILEADKPWYYYYRILATIGVFFTASVAFFFRHDNAAKYASEISTSHGGNDAEGQGDATNAGAGGQMEVFRNVNVWLVAILLCCYNGIELGISGWIVTYMSRVRGGDSARMGFVSSGFWAGLTIGRVALGFLTGMFKEQRRAVSIYITLAVASYLAFFFVSSLILSAITIFWVGFFIGPIFPSTMVFATSLLPKRLHVSGIATAAALSGIGSSVFPVLIGSLVNVYGAEAIAYVILTLFMVMVGLWTVFTR